MTIKSTDFPIESDDALAERPKGIEAYGVDLAMWAREFKYPPHQNPPPSCGSLLRG